MLVCNVSLRPPRGAIAATIAEAVTATATTTIEAAVLAALVDDPAAVTDAVDAYLGEIMLEAASASDTASVETGDIDAAIDEPVTATDAPDATMLAAYAATYDGLATNTVVSNGGLTVLHNNTTTNSGAISTAFQSTGKYYFEVTLQTSTTNLNYLGIMSSAWASVFSTSQFNSFSTSVPLSGTSTIVSNGGSTGKALGAQAVGDVFSAAIDLTAHLGWFRKNGGNWNGDGAANPATGTGGVTIAAGSYAPIVRFATGSASTDQMTGNFGQAAFVYSAPSGFGNWPAAYVANAVDFNEATPDWLSR